MSENMDRQERKDVVKELEDSGFKLEDTRDRTKKRNIFMIGSAVAVLAVLYVWNGSTTDDKKKDSYGDEQFDTRVFSPPKIIENEKPAEEKTEILTIPDKPATTTFEVPPPPPAKTVEMPTVAEEIPERYKSKMIVLDRAEKTSADENRNERAGSGDVSTTNKHTAFLNTTSAQEEKTVKAKQLRRIDALIAEGTMIPGRLETAINSDLPGQIRAIVSEDVYSFDGRRVLVPAGTRLIGEYQSDLINGQTRVFVVWTRLIRQDGASISLGSMGTDSLGRSGMTGHVDKKFRERFSSSILLSIVGAGTSYAVGQRSNRMNYYSNDRDGADEARQTIAQTFSDMANTVLKDNINIPPTITVDQGAAIFVFVRHDLDFSDFYEDPVVEALKQIKKERHLE